MASVNRSVVPDGTRNLRDTAFPAIRRLSQNYLTCSIRATKIIIFLVPRLCLICANLNVPVRSSHWDEMIVARRFRNCLKTQNRERIVPLISFPGSAWECMTWRLCLHYGPEFQTVTRQSPVDMGSQAEPGNQENDNLRSTN